MTPKARHGRQGRRDRHGRGIRGPFAPRTVPLSRTRAESFDELVLDAVEQVEEAVGGDGRGAAGDAALADRVAAVELGVEDVPPDPGVDVDLSEPAVPLGRTEPGTATSPARLVIYRRPLELRATDPSDRALLVHEVVVELLAELLDVDPDDLDDTTDDGPGDDDRGSGGRGPARP